MVLVFFWDTLLLGKAPLMRDGVFCFFPWYRFNAQALSSGHLPLWNHYTNCGQPYMAQPQTGVLYYPVSLLYLVLPAIAAFKASLILHQFLAAAGMYALLRQWKLGRGASLMGATAFGFCTLTVAIMEFESLFFCYAWLPVLLLVASRILGDWQAVRVGEAGATAMRVAPLAALLGLIYATALLAGYPETIVVYGNVLLAALVIAFSFAIPSWRGRAGAVATLALSAIIALCIVAPQILLTRELLPLSVRASEYDSHADQASLGLRNYPAFVLPFWNGRPGEDTTRTNLFEFWVGTCYVGLVPLALALLAVAYVIVRWRHMHRQSRFIVALCTAMLVLSLLIAAGQYLPVYGFLRSHVPVFDRSRWPSKALQVSAIALAVQSACGLQLLLSTRIRGMHLLSAGLIVCTFLNLFYVGRQIHPVREDWVYTSTGSIPTQLLESRTEPSRVFAVTREIQGWLYGKGDMALYEWAKAALVGDFLLPTRVFRVIGGGELELLDWAQLRATIRELPPEVVSRLLDLVNARYAVLPNWPEMIAGRREFGLPITHRPGANPRAYVVFGIDVEHEAPAGPEGRVLQISESLSLLLNPEYDLRGRATVAPDAQTSALQQMLADGVADDASSTVSVIRYGWNRVDVRVETNRPGLLVLSDCYYPGWIAEVDGQRQHIFRTNGFFRGVSVPQGSHRVAFVYRPRGFPAALSLSSVATLAAVFVSLCGPRIRRRGPTFGT